MNEIYEMHPLLVYVSDGFTHTKAGEENLRNLSKVFQCDLLRFNINPRTLKKIIKIAFEKLGSPTWPIGLTIYSVPLKIALDLNISLIVYGENISYEYGRAAVEIYSAREQIKNDVVEEIDWKFWFDRGITLDEVKFLEYASSDELNKLEPIFLSYFYSWDGYKNYLIAKRFVFNDSNEEWQEEGFVENYDEIDGIGYVIQAQMRYPNDRNARATDMACNLIRNGYITRKEGIRLVKENDNKPGTKMLEDFFYFLEYTVREFYEIVDKFYNREIFEKTDYGWKLKDPILKQEKYE